MPCNCWRLVIVLMCRAKMFVRRLWCPDCAGLKVWLSHHAPALTSIQMRSRRAWSRNCKTPFPHCDLDGAWDDDVPDGWQQVFMSSRFPRCRVEICYLTRKECMLATSCLRRTTSNVRNQVSYSTRLARQIQTSQSPDHERLADQFPYLSPKNSCLS